MNPLTGHTGYDIGTFITPTCLPAALNNSQSVSQRMSRVVTNRRFSYSPGRAAVKLKMPCLPGLRPVKNEVHAGAVTGGTMDSSTPQHPRCMSRSSAGNRLASIIGRSTRHVAPSRPRINTRGLVAIEAGLYWVWRIA
jgi:hypothetical protein